MKFFMIIVSPNFLNTVLKSIYVDSLVTLLMKNIYFKTCVETQILGTDSLSRPLAYYHPLMMLVVCNQIYYYIATVLYIKQ